MPMLTTSVYRENLKYFLHPKVEVVVNQGGTRSGKTTAILQILLLLALSRQKSDGLFVISVVSRALPHLKMGAMRDMDEIITNMGYSLSCKNISANTYKFGNAVIEFFGADQMDKVHGPGRDILFLNEANFIKYEIFDQLATRTGKERYIKTKKGIEKDPLSGKIFIDFNPTRRFWVHDEFEKNRSSWQFIKSTYLDNEQLPELIRKRIESHKDNPNWWRVYGMGEIGTSEGAIFTNWRYAKDGEFPVINHGFGLDYGFYPDPDALVQETLDRKDRKIYLKECIYENMNGTAELITKMKNFCDYNDHITAESATPRTNYDLQKVFHNLKAVSKTKTVAEWLRKMQDYEMIIHPDSYNLELELSNYCWNDKKREIPMDGFNHLIDAARYRFMTLNKKVWRNW